MRYARVLGALMGAMMILGAARGGSQGYSTVAYDIIAGSETAALNAASISSGGQYNCTLTDAGGVWCWGANGVGQLGDSTTEGRWIPVENSVVVSVVAITAGWEHACAVISYGGVWCWGWNYYGQLGDGNTGDISTIPVEVVALKSGVSAVAAGKEHTCALTDSGGVKCWGYNNMGQLGDGSITTRLSPVDVVGLSSGVSAITAGEWHTCALTEAGGVKCWGANLNGQLGDGTTTSRLTPVNVVGLSSGVNAISGGDEHTCALTSGGGVKCWGANLNGQLGDGSTTDRLTPVDVIGLTSGVSAIAAGKYQFSCAVTTTGSVKCWGRNNYGQLGAGDTATHLTPVDVLGLSSEVIAVAAGQYHACAQKLNGDVLCWGHNSTGQLGDGNSALLRLSPVDVVDLNSGVSAITTGAEHNCALSTGEGVKCWGRNQYGQLGTSNTENGLTPVEVLGLGAEASAVGAGDNHTCAVTNAGGAQCWGRNEFGQLGDGSIENRLTPVGVSGLGSGMNSIDGGNLHTCVLTTGGGVRCWGWNANGQLGDGTSVQSLTPVDVVGLSSGVSAITLGGNHTCALTTGGGVKCWGTNSDGQLGDGTTTRRLTPVDVVGLSSGVNAIAAGISHTCAVTTDGGVKCWGDNYFGKLGDGTMMIDRLTPVDVVGLSSGVSAVSAGRLHTCALIDSGGVKCWGFNGGGQLGDGSTQYRLTPVDVMTLSSGVSAVSVGDTHTCALTADGGVKCWGSIGFGQVGDGTAVYRPYPDYVIWFGAPESFIYLPITAR